MKYGVLGHRGMLGSAIIRVLALEPVWIFDGDLTRQSVAQQASELALRSRVKALFICAGKVGGIQANLDEPVDFLRTNLLIAINTLELCFACGIKPIYFGSSCIYPREAVQPIKECSLLTGPLESSNEPYALAKIAGIKLCEAYGKQYGLPWLALMPCNLYGPGDHYDTRKSHVIPALIRKFHQAKENRQSAVSIWGTGKPLREFMHVDDCTAAAIYLVSREVEGVLNVGTGEEISIANLARLIAQVVGYSGHIEFDDSKPDGTMRKVLNIERLRAHGWTQQRSLSQGVEQTYHAYLETL